MPDTTIGLATSFITFSRPGASGGGATVTDRDGRIKWAGHNLLSNSESFGAAAWAKNNVAITSNVAVAPNSTTTADLMYPLTSGTFRSVYQTSVNPGTVSVYAKAAGISHLYFVDKAGSTAIAWFNLSTGVKGTVSGGYTSEITPIGDGWYKCSITAPSGPYSYVQIGLSDADNSNSVTASGTNGIYIWGAHHILADLGGMQLNPAMPAGMQSYYPTTPRNLLGATEAFSDAAWGRLNVTISSNALLAPNGLQTADTITASSGSNAIYQSISASATRYTASAYFKAGTDTSPALYIATSANALGGSAVFNLTAVTSSVTNYGATTGSTASITSVGDGWFRCSLSVTATAATYFYQVSLSASGLTLNMWGAQLSDSASLDTYVPQYGAAVTSAAYYAPRLDFDGATLAARGLLVEELRTNLFQQSNGFGTSPWYTGFGTLTVTAAAGVSPDSNTNAFSIANATGSAAGLTQNHSATSGVAYTFSVWLRCASGTVAAQINAANGTPSNITVTTTWQRFSVTTTASTTATVQNTITVPANSTVFAYGAQLEAGSFATSYIPNGSAVAGATRAADVASVSTGAFPYSQSEGSLVFNLGALNLAGTMAGNAPYDTAIGIVTDGSRGGRQFSAQNNSGWLIVNKTGTPTLGSAISGSSALAPLNGSAAAQKLAIAISASEMAGVVNGGTVTTTALTAAPTGTANLLYINPSMNGHIRQVTYLPRRISNAELQSRSA